MTRCRRANSGLNGTRGTSADTEHRFRTSGCKGAVKVHAPLIDLVDDALAQPCPVPVVSDDGRLVGELGRDAFLRAMRRRG